METIHRLILAFDSDGVHVKFRHRSLGLYVTYCGIKDSTEQGGSTPLGERRRGHGGVFPAALWPGCFQLGCAL